MHIKIEEEWGLNERSSLEDIINFKIKEILNKPELGFLRLEKLLHIAENLECSSWVTKGWLHKNNIFHLLFTGNVKEKFQIFKMLVNEIGKEKTQELLEEKNLLVKSPLNTLRKAISWGSRDESIDDDEKLRDNVVVYLEGIDIHLDEQYTKMDF